VPGHSRCAAATIDHHVVEIGMDALI